MKAKSISRVLLPTMTLLFAVTSHAQGNGAPVQMPPAAQIQGTGPGQGSIPHPSGPTSAPANVTNQGSPTGPAPQAGASAPVPQAGTAAPVPAANIVLPDAPKPIQEPKPTRVAEEIKPRYLIDAKRMTSARVRLNITSGWCDDVQKARDGSLSISLRGKAEVRFVDAFNNRVFVTFPILANVDAQGAEALPCDYISRKQIVMPLKRTEQKTIGSVLGKYQGDAYGVLAIAGGFGKLEGQSGAVLLPSETEGNLADNWFNGGHLTVDILTQNRTNTADVQIIPANGDKPELQRMPLEQVLEMPLP